MDYLAVDRHVERHGASLPPDEARAWKNRFWSLFASGEFPAAYLGNGAIALVTGSVGHRVVDYADGPGWQGVLEALIADERVMAVSVLADSPARRSEPPAPDFRPVTRWEHRFDLRHAPPSVGSPPEGYRVHSYDPARRHEAAALLASTNHGLDGLFLTFPELPSVENCLVLIERLESGILGPFVPEVSFLAFKGEQLVGLTLAVRPSEGDVLLYEIAVRLRHRGSGLATHLLDRLKRELADQGRSSVLFGTLSTNSGANALFHASQGASVPGESAWIWQRA